MKRIILHWTAGGQVPNSHEKECYHFLVDSFGKVRLGHFKPEANLNCKSGMKANLEYPKFNYWLTMYNKALANMRSKLAVSADETPSIVIRRGV